MKLIRSWVSSLFFFVFSVCLWWPSVRSPSDLLRVLTSLLRFWSFVTILAKLAWAFSVSVSLEQTLCSLLQHTSGPIPSSVNFWSEMTAKWDTETVSVDTDLAHQSLHLPGHRLVALQHPEEEARPRHLHHLQVFHWYHQQLQCVHHLHRYHRRSGWLLAPDCRALHWANASRRCSGLPRLQFGAMTACAPSHWTSHTTRPTRPY